MICFIQELYRRDSDRYRLLGLVSAPSQRGQLAKAFPQVHTLLQVERKDHSARHIHQPHQLQQQGRKLAESRES